MGSTATAQQGTAFLTGTRPRALVGAGASDDTLIAAATDGDERAVAYLYDRYGTRIFNYCRRIVGCADDAADATQEAFLKTLQRLPDLSRRDEFNFLAYTHVVARNVCYRIHRRDSRTELVDEPPQVTTAGLARNPGPLDEDPERAVLLESVRDTVRDAHDLLPERQR